MSPAPALGGARLAAEEIFPQPALPRLLGGRTRARRIEGRRREVERIISAHCIDRGVGLQAHRALTAGMRHLALAGRNVPPEIAAAMAELERALGMA